MVGVLIDNSKILLFDELLVSFDLVLGKVLMVFID